MRIAGFAVGRRSILLVVGAGALPLSGCDAPMTFVRGEGPFAYPVVSLSWGYIAICLAVVVIIAVLLVLALFRRPALATMGDRANRPRGGLSWISVGVGISSVALVAMLGWTLATLRAVADAGGGDSSLTIEVRAHQWWWEVRYSGSAADRGFTTANEIHIPVGEPVRVRLVSGDVIHSFWVPALAGKTDVIPGQTNIAWIEASRPGIYRGQCAEYCGDQHAHMALRVIAQPRNDFDAWWSAQLAPAAPTTAGATLFVERCGACHSVRGTSAGGTFGPDLSHLMSRTTIAAGTLPNRPGQLKAWIADPQGIKPGSQMPNLDLPAPELTTIASFLQTLD